VLILLVPGCSRQAIAAAYGFDEQTIKNWWQQAGEYCQNVWRPDVVKEEIVNFKNIIS
jgi:hypothetical protein